MKWRLIVSFTICFIMLFCFITKEELFPFAPYTMYSYIFSPQHQKIIKLYFYSVENNWIEIQNRHIYPFDEARAKQAISQIVNESGNQLSQPKIKQMLEELLVVIQKKNQQKVLRGKINIISYKNLDDLRKGNETIINSLVLDVQ